MKKLDQPARRRRPRRARGGRAGVPGAARGAPRPTLRRPHRRPGRRQGGVISGGGSGHEPLHGGFVGKGMLDAACPGQVFTSPSPDQMEAATQAVDGGAGVLHIVKNYTGDVMNFEMAAELARPTASRWRRSLSTTTSRSRTACTRRAAAASGRPCWRKRSAVRRPPGVGTRPRGRAGPQGERTRPLHGHGLDLLHGARAGKPTFELGEDEIEMGVGIHGETGPRAPADGSGRTRSCGRWRRPSDDLPFRGGDRGHRHRQRHGRHAAHRALPGVRGAAPIPAAAASRSRRSLVGNYITTLDMAGCSITLLRLDDELTALWDAPVNTPACGGAHERDVPGRGRGGLAARVRRGVAERRTS